MAEEFPRLRVQLSLAWSDALFRELQAGTVDAALVYAVEDLPPNVVGERVAQPAVSIIDSRRRPRTRGPMRVTQLNTHPRRTSPMQMILEVGDSGRWPPLAAPRAGHDAEENRQPLAHVPIVGRPHRFPPGESLEGGHPDDRRSTRAAEAVAGHAMVTHELHVEDPSPPGARAPRTHTTRSRVVGN
jgi:DNA-binding transcriptional LysR family regulator